jgi:hypothetical protein
MVQAYDNGCFAGSWQADRWEGWLRKQRPGLFAVVPDVVGDARATRERFDRYADVVSGRQPVAYVAQDGSDLIPPPWDDLAVLFIGGTDAFKLSEATWALCAEGKARGKWVHIGRVNSLRRLRAAYIGFADSADGTFLKYGRLRSLPSDPRWPQMCAWMDGLHRQERMWSA